MVLGLREVKGAKDLRDLKDLRDHKDLRGLKGLKDLRGRKGLGVLKELQELQETQVLKAHRVLRGHKALKVPKAQQDLPRAEEAVRQEDEELEATVQMGSNRCGSALTTDVVHAAAHARLPEVSWLQNTQSQMLMRSRRRRRRHHPDGLANRHDARSTQCSSTDAVGAVSDMSGRKRDGAERSVRGDDDWLHRRQAVDVDDGAQSDELHGSSGVAEQARADVKAAVATDERGGGKHWQGDVCADCGASGMCGGIGGYIT